MSSTRELLRSFWSWNICRSYLLFGLGSAVCAVVVIAAEHFGASPTWSFALAFAGGAITREIIGGRAWMP